MCWGAGILLSSGVVRAVAHIEGDMGWRLPFLLQWIWPVPLFIGAYFAPESPWNAVRRGDSELAKRSLMRLRGDSPQKEAEVEAALAFIKHTTALEAAETEGAGFTECFKGTNLRRTEIVSFQSFLNKYCETDLMVLELCRLDLADHGWQCSCCLCGDFPPSSGMVRDSILQPQHLFVCLLRHWWYYLLVSIFPYWPSNSLHDWFVVHFLLQPCHRRTLFR